MRIAVFGAGGVGGYFGARWAEAGRDVVFLARGKQLAALRANGLTLKSPVGDAQLRVRAEEPASAAGRFDLIVIATKTWQLPDALVQVRPLVGKETVVFGLQNGVEAADLIAGELGDQHALAGSCRLMAFVEEPGVIRHVGGHPILFFGERNSGGGPSQRTQQLATTLTGARGMTLHRSDDMPLELWKKLHFFEPLASVGSVTRATVGVVRTLPQVRALLETAMREVLDVATARGVRMPADAMDVAMKVVESFPANGTSSMQRDFRDGKRTELEALTGAIVRQGDTVGVDTPAHDVMYAALLPQEQLARD